MRGILNFMLTLVAIGVVSLFAAFFSILGLNKKEVWDEIYKRLKSK